MDELTADMLRYADFLVNFARAEGYDLNYSEDSVRLADEMVEKYHPNGATLDTTVYTYGAYLGEVLRRNIGGQWANTEADGLHFQGVNFQAGPIYWAQCKFGAPTDESMAHRIVALKTVLEMEDTSLSTHIPEPVEVPPAPLAEGEAPATEDADGATAEEKARHSFELFGKAPAVIFMLVAGADGTIDQKEMKKFRQILEGFKNHKSPLFKMSISSFLSNTEGILMEVQNYSHIQKAAMLSELTDYIPTSDANLRQEFLESLYELGEQIAKASGGGFLGLGASISDKEKAALRIVAGMLGLKQK